MSKKSSRIHLVAMICAALNLGLGCQIEGRDDSMFVSGVAPHVDASQATRAATGIVTWAVVPVGDETLAVAGLNAASIQITSFLIRTNDEDFSVEIGDGRRLEMTIAGEPVESSLTDEDVATLLYFRDDTASALATSSFRVGLMDCLNGLEIGRAHV